MVIVQSLLAPDLLPSLAQVLPNGVTMKTVGYVLADFPVLSETFVGNEMRAMEQQGHRVVPIVMHLKDGPAQTLDIELAKTAKLPSRTPVFRVLQILFSPSKNFLSALRFVWSQQRLSRRSLFWNGLKVAAVAKDNGCQHLHAHFAGGATAHAIVAARWLGVGVSFICHGHDVYSEAEDLELKLVSADMVIATCTDMAHDLAQIAPDAQIEVITCGVDPSGFRPAVDSAPIPRFLFVGRFVEQKGIDDLLSAISLHGTASVDLVGDGPLREECRQRAAELGLGDRVRFLGPRKREWLEREAPRYLGLIAPFKIAPDLSRDTGPMVIKEAMSMGLPVVTTRFMGNKDVVTPGCGFLTEVADPVALSAAIQKVLDLTPPDRATMAARSRARIMERFSLKVQAQSLSQVFEAI
ncbi:glycosyltransferase [Methylocystis echinoides]|nr:glycosyltransferase [Methylocystis echinoides]